MQKATGTYTTQAGIKLYYEVLNPDAPVAVVFLNGVMASINSWSRQAALLARFGYKIVMHDFKGQLLSDKPEGPYSFAEHSGETMELLNFLGIRSFHLVGTSYGGEVALRFAIDYPELPRSIAVIDSVSELDKRTRLFVEEWKRLAQAGDAERFFRAMLPSIYGSSYLVANSEFLEKRAAVMSSLPAEYLEGQIALYDTFLNDLDLTAELAGIKCPVLVVCGQDDVLKPPSFSSLIASKVACSEFAIIPDCGHVTILEKPEVLGSLLAGFIGKHSLAPGDS